MFIHGFHLVFLIINIVFAAEEPKKQPAAAAAAASPQNAAAMEIVLENVKFAVFNQDAGQPTDADLHRFRFNTK